MERLLRIAGLAGMIAVLSGAPANAAGTLTPFVDCHTSVAAGDGGVLITDYFGYANTTGDNERIPVGSANFMSPAPFDRGQPTSFDPGTFHRVVSATWDTSASASMSWFLADGSVTDDGTSPACGPNTVLNGSGPPADSLGNDGDFYIDTAADVMYGPKALAHWPTPGVSLIGPAGTNGTNGTNGTPGTPGANGTNGTNGTPGTPGTPGASGTNGTNGTPGAPGNTILHGAGPPSDALGANGDFYLDTKAEKLYGAKSGGHWPTSGVSLIGPPGVIVCRNTDAAKLVCSALFPSGTWTTAMRSEVSYRLSRAGRVIARGRSSIGRHGVTLLGPRRLNQGAYRLTIRYGGAHHWHTLNRTVIVR